VIPNPILRSTYLSDLASRLGLKEQTLIETMNQFIRKEKEQPQQSISQPLPEDTQSTETQQQGNYSLPTGRTGGGSAVETLLMREVIRHGEEVIYDNVETEDGGIVSFNVAQYIDYDLGQDGLQLSDERYRQILQEAVEHSGEKGFKAETYFMNHPDIEVSQLATKLAIDRHQLGGRFVIQPREGSLRQRVVHLVMDLRMDLIDGKLKEIQAAMREASGNMERVMQLMTEFRDTQQLRDMLARKLGSDIMK
jgi:DNA primase